MRAIAGLVELKKHVNVRGGT